MQSESKSLIRKNFNLIKSPPKPAWIKIKLKNKEISSTKNIISKNELNTVCEEAMCPNLHECWSKTRNLYDSMIHVLVHVVFAILKLESLMH